MALHRAVAVFVFVAGTSAVASAQQSTLLMGTVTYRERIVLPASAIVEVRLEDVTRAETAPPVVTRTQIANPGNVPIRFNLDVDRALLSPQHRYAVRATIVDGKTVLFTSMDTALVLTQGHGSRVELVLTQVGAPKPQPQDTAPVAAPPLPQNPVSDLPATYVGTIPCLADCDSARYQLNLFGDDSFFLRTTTLRKGAPETTADELGSWALSSDRQMLVLHGNGQEQMFTVDSQGILRRNKGELRRTAPFRPLDVHAPMRGAYASGESASFIECSTGQRWYVADEGAGKELASTYAKSRPAPGAPLLVEIDGTTRTRDASAGSQTMLVVDRVRRALPKETCAPRFAAAPLAETYWRLTNLGDRTMPPSADRRREPSMTFTAETSSYSGSTGCNRVVGTYTAVNATMAFKPGGTMTACKDDPKADAAFLSALQAAHTYRITGRTLELFDAKGARLARFEAVAPAGITVR